jgi:subtilisin inhibitor-like
MRTGILPAQSAARYILIALLCAAAASACGSVRASGQAPARAAGHTSAGTGAAAVRLVIAVTSHPGAKPQRWTLRCDPVGGTHPHARAACNVLKHAKNPFAPVRPNMMCPATPAARTATITGTWFGHPVNATYTQTGCGLPRWRQVRQVFP